MILKRGERTERDLEALISIQVLAHANRTHPWVRDGMAAYCLWSGAPKEEKKREREERLL